MFCPNCATSNPDQAKFCRACGTNLETVAQALGGQSISTSKTTKKTKKKDEEPKTREEWVKKRAKGVRQIIQGVILLAFSLLVGGIGMQITMMADNDLFAWLAMWIVFFGWAAGWGIVSLALGIGDMIESKMVLREMGPMVGGQATASTTPLLPAADLQMIPRALDTSQQIAPPSVTEQTTVPLGEHEAPHHEIMRPERLKES
jgi:hypothetical protein